MAHLPSGLGGLESSPSDDPADYSVRDRAYRIEVSEPEWLVPSDRLPSEVEVQAANNNVELVLHEGRRFVAWRTARISPTRARLVISSADEGTWVELTRTAGADLRESVNRSFDSLLHGARHQPDGV